MLFVLSVCRKQRYDDPASRTREERKLTQSSNIQHALTGRNELAKKQSPALGIPRIHPHSIPNTNRHGAPRHILGMHRPHLVGVRRRLHPRRGTPRRRDDAHTIHPLPRIGLVDGLHGEEHHAYHARVDVVLDRGVEVGEVKVVLGVVEGVGFYAEVAGVDVRAAETGRWYNCDV